ncbi:MAG TPA: peptidoglycan bridge formation glycyltransferase FemA/FemB family protein [Candidatus Saccharimonadales bacterium]|nr:peptidoglycan bridge formation glycyltransferase FemA/FemB family protein [Candidatus Saccharimonadales bacterium]
MADSNTHNDTAWNAHQRTLGASFLQSAEWDTFQQALGYKTHALRGSGWSCLLVERSSRLGTYLLAPYGPTVAHSDKFADALTAIVAYGREIGVDWIRLEPYGLPTAIDPSTLVPAKDVKLAKAPHQMNPELTMMVDLTPAADDILAHVSQSTRSYIRKNQREHMLTFKTSTDPADIDVFVDMLQVVSERSQARFYGRDFFVKQAQTLMPTGMMHLELALQDGKPIASAVMHYYHGVATYTYAASLPEARATNASALLLWQAMMNAKGAGMTAVDLFGIAPDDASADHPWHGFTAFKKKFGGTTLVRGTTVDIPLRPVYRLYRPLVKMSRFFKI